MYQLRSPTWVTVMADILDVGDLMSYYFSARRRPERAASPRARAGRPRCEETLSWTAKSTPRWTSLSYPEFPAPAPPYTLKTMSKDTFLWNRPTRLDGVGGFGRPAATCADPGERSPRNVRPPSARNPRTGFFIIEKLRDPRIER